MKQRPLVPVYLLEKEKTAGKTFLKYIFTFKKKSLTAQKKRPQMRSFLMRRKNCLVN